MIDPAYADWFSCLASTEPGCEMGMQLPPPLQVPLSDDCGGSGGIMGKKYLPFSFTRKERKKGIFLLNL